MYADLFIFCFSAINHLSTVFISFFHNSLSLCGFFSLVLPDVCVRVCVCSVLSFRAPILALNLECKRQASNVLLEY